MEEDSVMDNTMDYSSYLDSSIEYTIDTSDSTGCNYKNSTPIVASSKTSENPVRHPLNSVEWLVNCIWTSNTARAVGELRAWVPSNRQREISEETVTVIRKLPVTDAIEAVNSFKRKHYVRGTKGKDLKLTVTVENISNGRQLEAEALLDCGATGSCINMDFVKKHNLPVRPLLFKMPVFNADGTLNASGSITGMAEIRMVIGDHSERIELGVTNLGKMDIFLGLDWLRLHNPNIDWKESTLIFDRCPERCGYIPWWYSPEGEASLNRLEEDERLFIFDWEGYINDTGHIHAATSEPSKADPYVQAHPSVFNKKGFDELPTRRPWDHAIELIPGSKPVDCKIYPLNLDEQKALDEFLEENLKTGRIRPSNSPMASPFFFIKKKDGTLRPVQDYRKLNDMTIKNCYPLPLIQELIDKLKMSKVFTKMDIRWGFNNIHIKEGDEWKAAFRTNRGLFEPTVMFFGLTDSPSTFQSFMNHILKPLIDEGHVIVYMDDILVFTEDLSSHRKIVHDVLHILETNGLYLKPEKCTFETSSVDYLGIIVGNGQVRMDPKKVAAVTDWPIPKKKKDVQSFLGFCNFFRRFIRGFSHVARPLSQLTSNKEWSWGKAEQDAFEILKSRITEDVTLAIPLDNGTFRVEADSSDYANGAVLSQQVDGKWRPIAFRSRSLNDVECNYEIYDKEMMAIMDSLSEWRQYLLGAREPFEIWNDHQNLQYFQKPNKLNRRQARWMTELAEYEFKLHHKPGKSMGKADALSRMTNLETGVNDNENLVLLKPEMFVRTLTEEPETEIIEKIKKYISNVDKSVVDALNAKDKSWTNEQGGIITWKNRIYVPKNKQL